jgi:hypothetical protein
MPALGKRLASLEALRASSVLGGGREQELVSRAARPAAYRQSQGRSRCNGWQSWLYVTLKGIPEIHLYFRK